MVAPKGIPSVALDLDDWEGWGGWNNLKTYPWIVKEYIDRQEKWLIRRVPVLTAASRALQRRAQELRKSPRGVFYIPNGWSFRKTWPHGAAGPSVTGAARKSFGLPDGPAIFYGGHFDPADDVLFFVARGDAARRFGATLVFVGEGPELPKVKQFLAQRDGLIAFFFPRLPNEKFLQLVAASDIAAFPYPDTPIYQAKCSARIVDYMAMGKPVVTTTVGQNIDYLVDGESGVLTSPGDASQFGQSIERLLGNPELRFRLGQNARKRIERNSRGMARGWKTAWPPTNNSQNFHLSDFDTTTLRANSKVVRTMQIFIDSADVKQIETWLAQGIVDGATTNPSIMFKDGVKDLEDGARKLAALLGDRPLSVEVTSNDHAIMLKQARLFATWARNIVIKIPIVNQFGEPSLGIIHQLTQEGIGVNTTAILAFNQAILAAKAGATYVSIFAGRVADEGSDPAIVIRRVRSWLDEWELPARIIVGSIRGVVDIQNAALAGAHIITFPPQFLPKMVDHHYTRETVRQFVQDAEKTDTLIREAKAGVGTAAGR